MSPMNRIQLEIAVWSLAWYIFLVMIGLLSSTVSFVWPVWFLIILQDTSDRAWIIAVLIGCALTVLLAWILSTTRLGTGKWGTYPLVGLLATAAALTGLYVCALGISFMMGWQIGV